MFLPAALVTCLPAAAVLGLVSQISPLSAGAVAALALVPRAVSGATLFLAVALAVALWHFHQGKQMGHCCFWTAWWSITGLATVTAVLQVPYHPCFSIAAIAFLGPVLLYPMRYLAVPHAQPEEWFGAVWKAMATAALLCVSAWVPWICMGFDGRQKWTDWPPEFRAIVQAKVISWKCAFAAWACPPAIGLELGLVSVLCWVRQRYSSYMEAPSGEMSPASAMANKLLLTSVKQVAGWLFALLMLIWIQATMNATGQQEFNQRREDMSDEVVGLAFLSFLTLTLWILDTVGPSEVSAAVQQSKTVQETAKMLQNDWVRAFVFFVASVPMGLLVLGDDAFCWLCGKRKEREERPLLQWTANWRWTSVLVKASWLGQIYVLLMVGIGKVTTVLLAMINEHFSGWPVYTVSALMFVITLVIFLFPASPGPPIYVVMGIVICSSASKQGWSFSAGLWWATLVAYVMKLAFTAVAQKCIGEPFSRNEDVRRLVCIHTPYMRAIEMVLKDSRVTVAKVALLVGGPDWPIAVLCGMLRLSVLSVQIAISPVLVQSVFPSVLAGALLLDQSGHENDGRTPHGMAEVTLVVAGGLQLIMGVIAFYHVQEILERNWEELSRSRPEDAELENLEEQASALDRAFWRETDWSLLPSGLRAALIGGLLCMQVCVALLSMQESCFKKFGLMSSVDKDLGGRVLSIVQPWGWVAVGLAVVDGLALASFYIWCKTRTRGAAGSLLDREEAAMEGKAIL